MERKVKELIDRLEKNSYAGYSGIRCSDTGAHPGDRRISGPEGRCAAPLHLRKFHLYPGTDRDQQLLQKATVCTAASAGETGSASATASPRSRSWNAAHKAMLWASAPLSCRAGRIPDFPMNSSARQCAPYGTDFPDCAVTLVPGGKKARKSIACTMKREQNAICCATKQPTPFITGSSIRGKCPGHTGWTVSMSCGKQASRWAAASWSVLPSRQRSAWRPT